jgi:hypothetical protein
MLLRSWNGSTFTNNVKITPTSNVGIGTTSPTQRLDVRDGFILVSGSGASGYGYLLNRAGQDTYSIRHLDGGLTINNETDNVKEMTFLGNGNVGINKINPSARLEIRGSGATSATTAFRVENSNASASLVVLDDRQTRITSDEAALFVQGAGVSPFTQNIAEFRYAGNGNSLIIANISGKCGLTTSTNLDLNISPNGTGVTVFRDGKQVTLNNSNNNGIIALQNTGATGQTRLDFITGSSTILSISGSGRVGVGTTTPQRLFDVYNSSTSGIAASFGAQISINNFSGISFGYVEQANTLYRKSALVFERTDGHGGGGNASGKIHFLLNNNSSTSATALTDSVLTIDSVGTTVGSSRVGIGTRFPTASLHISGTVATDNLMRVQSTTGAEYFFISASGNVGVGLLTPSARLHVSGANNQSLLRVSSPSASAALFISGSGNVGIGTETPTGVIDVFQGGNSRILVKADDGFVGIQQPSPTERIHITSDPATSKYLRIDAAQATNPPPRYLPAVPAKEIYGQNADDFALGTPDYWMEIILNGNIVLIPCYLPN